MSGADSAQDENKKRRPQQGRTIMKRREFLKAAGVGVATSTIAAPAIAQSMPELKWRLTASWPKSLDTLYGGCEYFAKRVAEITDNKFQIQVFAAGRDRARAAGAGRRAERHRRDGQYRALLLFRQGSRVHLRHGAAVRAQRPPDELLASLRRRLRAAQRSAERLQLHRGRGRAIPARRWAAGSARRSSRSTT